MKMMMIDFLYSVLSVFIGISLYNLTKYLYKHKGFIMNKKCLLIAVAVILLAISIVSLSFVTWC